MKIDFSCREQIPELLQLWKTAFGDHQGFWELFLRTGFSPVRCMCIEEKGQITAALCWLDCFLGDENLAYIYAVVTHPGHRGKGLCRVLLGHVHDHLKERGYASSLLVPEGEGLRQMYRKLGYTDCTTVSEFSCEAGKQAVSVRNVDAETYASMRRQFLPKGGVVQEGENLSFLSAQAQLFAGEDFLLAAYLEEDVLHGMEFLGNREAVPGILRFLGCGKGNFRTAGQGRAFAMFHPLQENAAIPRYFGIAFD